MPTALTPPAPADAVWRAGNDRIAHAHGPHALRTVCGMEIVQERLAWPAFRRCMVCQAALDQSVRNVDTCPLCRDQVPGRHPDAGGSHPARVAIPETELRALHGDR